MGPYGLYLDSEDQFRVGEVDSATADRVLPHRYGQVVAPDHEFEEVVLQFRLSRTLPGGEGRHQFPVPSASRMLWAHATEHALELPNAHLPPVKRPVESALGELRADITQVEEGSGSIGDR